MMNKNNIARAEQSAVWAVVVTYNPDLEVLARQLDALVLQVRRIVIIDNGSACDMVSWLPDCRREAVELVLLGKNCGIAAGHNKGIERAERAGAGYALLMDQDSLPCPDMVSELLKAYSAYPDSAAVGPRYLDTRQNNTLPFIRVEGLRLMRCACSSKQPVVAVDYLISSGSLISLDVLRKVGGMREDLFIDYVDIEWGLRAKRCGLQSYGCCMARMLHSLGEEPVSFFGRLIPMHSPLRHYYHFRNAVLLYKLPWIAFNWKLVDGWRLCQKYIFYSLLSGNGFSHLRMMTLGIRHGLVGRSGRFDR